MRRLTLFLMLCLMGLATTSRAQGWMQYTPGACLLTGCTMTGPILYPSGSAAAPSVSWSGDTTKGIYFDTFGVYIANSGVQNARFREDGAITFYDPGTSNITASFGPNGGSLRAGNKIRISWDGTVIRFLDDADATKQLEFDMATITTGQVRVVTWPDVVAGTVGVLAANGLYARTGAGTVAARTLTGGTGVTVVNGDGVSGNPTASVDTAVVDTYTSGTADPSASCGPGEFYKRTDTDEVWGCPSTNTWVKIARDDKHTQDLAFTADLTPSQITGDQNNYNPTDLADNTILRLDTDASRNITGLAGGADGRLIWIVNVGSNDLVLVDESASSTAGNRFALSANLTIGADEGAMLVYDSTSSRWRYVAVPGSGGGAPTDAVYIVGSADGTLSAERVVTDTDTLEWDQGTASQLKANTLGFLRPHVKRTTYCAMGLNPDNPHCIGAGDWNATGTNDFDVATATEYSMTGRVTAATSANQARANIDEGAFWFATRSLRAEWYASYDDITNARYWMGFIDSMGTAAGSADPTIHLAAFRFDTGVPDTNYQCVTNDASGGGTITDTGTAADGNPHTFTIIETNSTDFKFYIDGVLECTHTTDLPTGSAGFGILTTTLADEVNGIHWAYIYIEEDL